MKNIICVTAILLGSTEFVFAQSTTLVDNGDPSKRIDVVFVPYYYEPADLPTFIADCDNAVNQFRNTMPFQEYFSYFNFHRVTTNAFEAPDVDKVIIILNASGQSGAFLGGDAYVYRNQLSFVLLHEFGHSFGWLADEYVQGHETWTLGDPLAANLTASLSNPKWNVWMDPATPRPTPWYFLFPPESTGVGLFEGGGIHYSHGLYRPALNCKMSNGGSFDAICAEVLIQRIYEHSEIQTYDSVSPAAGDVTATTSATTFTVTPQFPTGEALTLLWYLDGALRQSGGTSFTLDASELAYAVHQIEVEIRDTTPRVRRDPESLLVDRVTWTLRRILAGIAVTPGTVSVAKGFHRNFSAVGLDPFGNPISIGRVIWSTNVGSIDSKGRYTAPQKAGLYTITARRETPTQIMTAMATARVPSAVVRGDANGDGVLTASDVGWLQDYIFLGAPTPAYLENADCNKDGMATSSDAVLLLQAVFLGVPLPTVVGPGTPLDE